jgi:hypothetical protein
VQNLPYLSRKERYNARKIKRKGGSEEKRKKD